MKNIILSLITIIMLFISVDIRAQQEGSIWINAITGLNSTWILNQNAYGNPELEYSTSFGFTGGMGVSYFFSDQWGFSGSMLATKMGQNYAGVQSGGDAERKVRLTYIEAPFQLMYHIPYTSNPTWVAFGPDILFLVKAEQEYFRKGGDPLPNPEGMKIGDIRERFNPFDVAINISLNKLYPLNVSNDAMFLLAFNTAVGLTDINDVMWKMPDRSGEYKGSHNFYLGIKAGLMFNATRDKKEKE